MTRAHITVDVLLTHSYHLYFDRKQARKMQPYPPLGTLYAAALLRSAGISVAVFDTMLNDPEIDFEEILERYRPRIVVVYEDNFNFLSKMCLTRMRQVAFRIATLSQEAGAVVLANGSDASDHCLDYLRHGFDCVLAGEAEQTLLEVTQCILRSGIDNISEVPGLSFLRKADGELVRTGMRPLMKDLDQLPFPARDLIDLRPYRDLWNKQHHRFSLNLVASRGCPYKCNWCAKPIYGDSFAVRSARSVAAEMQTLKYEYGAQHLWFADDIFGLRSRWIRDLADEVAKLDAAIPFKAQSRVDLMTNGNVEALSRAGCCEIWLGAESGSQKILDAMDKGTRVEQIVRARENLGRAGVRACYFLQFGYPGETWEDICKTVALVRETQPDDIGVSVSYPLPGTKFFEKVRPQLGMKTNWSDSEDLSLMFQGGYTDAFYRALHDALHARVETWNQPDRTDHERNQSRMNVSEELWRKVEQLEKVSRNPDATTVPQFADRRLVQVQAATCPTA